MTSSNNSTLHPIEKLKIALMFYLENWTRLTEELVIDLALYLALLDIDLEYSHSPNMTKEDHMEVLNYYIDKLWGIMERHKWYIETANIQPGENEMTIEEFLKNYHQIAEDNS